MLKITNYQVYDLKESVIACRNAMRTEAPKYTDEEFEESLKRAKQLAKCGGGSGHSNFRKGIRVSFDIKYPNYISPELQRYGFVDIVCSSSKMHKLLVMDMDKCFNKYTHESSIKTVKSLIRDYNTISMLDDDITFNSLYECVIDLENLPVMPSTERFTKQDVLYDLFMQIVSSCPQGIELFMRCSTNYEQLATIYKQRRNHKLKEDWGAFCDWIEKLPYSKELIICK